MSVEKLISFLICLMNYCALNAQFNETIRSDRPGQANGPFAVGKSVFQTQTGIDFNSQYLRNSNTEYQWISPNTVIRFGINKTIDFNTNLEYRFQETRISDMATSFNGFTSVSLGARIHIYEGKPKHPKIGAQVSMSMPNRSVEFEQKALNPALKIIIGQSLNNKFSYLINWGFNYDVRSESFSHNYVANIGYTISKSFNTFIENYGSISGAIHVNKWDTGLAYMANSNLQLDIYGGFYKFGDRQDAFVSAGISWRVLCKPSVINSNN
jgi:hypothetical protein